MIKALVLLVAVFFDVREQGQGGLIAGRHARPGPTPWTQLLLPVAPPVSTGGATCVCMTIPRPSPGPARSSSA